MTTVVAFARGKHTLMAADSVTNVFDRPVPGIAKVIRCATTSKDGHYLLGFAGEGAGPSVINQHHSVACLPDFGDVSDRNGWAGAVATAITELYLEHSLIDGQRMDGSVLLAARGHVWTLTHHQAIPHLDGIAAIGSGEGPAIGALHALIDAGRSPRHAIRKAVAYGILLDRYSGGAPLILEA